ELAILAARCLDMPFFFRPSYCFSFFTLALFEGTSIPPVSVLPGISLPTSERKHAFTRVAAVPSRRAAIVGVATSDYPSLPDMSEHQVHAQAAERALADAGLDFADVDGFATAGNFPMYAVGVCEYLG